MSLRPSFHSDLPLICVRLDKPSFRSLHGEAYELSISFEIGRNYPNFSADIATNKFYRDDLASLKESLHSLGADYVYTYDDLKDKQRVQEIRSNITLKVFITATTLLQSLTLIFVA